MYQFPAFLGIIFEQYPRSPKGTLYSRMRTKKICRGNIRIFLKDVDLPHLLGGMENEAVGIYLQAAGGIGGQMMLIFPYAKALS